MFLWPSRRTSSCNRGVLTMSPEDAMHQACYTTEFYIAKAVDHLSVMLRLHLKEDNYKYLMEKHPDLIALYVNTCTKDFDTWVRSQYNVD